MKSSASNISMSAEVSLRFNGLMNDLHQAILDGDAERVRRLLREQPGLLTTRSGSTGWTTLELARHKGNARIVATLLRAGAPGTESFKDWAEVLSDFVGWLSQESSAASWLGDIEHILWEYATTRRVDSEEVDPFRFSELPSEDYDTLMWLAEQAGGWPIYLGFLPLDAWSERHEQWLAQQHKGD